MSASANRGQALASGPAGGDGGQALLHVAAVPVEVRRRESPRASGRCVESRWPSAIEWSARDRDLSQVQAWKAATSCGLLDQAVLQGQ